MSVNGEPRYEYRVRWRREGRQGASTIYQGEQAARAKIDRLLALDELKGDTTRFEDMPDLVGVPSLQVREVGSWSEHPEPPASKSSAEARESMDIWLGDDDDDHGVF